MNDANSSFFRSHSKSNSTSAEKNPLDNFSPAENEVFGNDASKLSRTYSVELRFSVE